MGGEKKTKKGEKSFVPRLRLEVALISNRRLRLDLRQSKLQVSMLHSKRVKKR